MGTVKQDIILQKNSDADKKIEVLAEDSLISKRNENQMQGIDLVLENQLMLVDGGKDKAAKIQSKVSDTQQNDDEKLRIKKRRRKANKTGFPNKMKKKKKALVDTLL